MTSKRHLVMLAFLALALGISFSAGWAANSNTCDPSDCAKACQVMSAEECAKVCPPECVVLCDEPRAASQSECMPGCGISSCSSGKNASGVLAGVDPAGTLSFKLAAGQGAEIMK